MLHLAAVSRVIDGERNPDLCWRVNADGDPRAAAAGRPSARAAPVVHLCQLARGLWPAGYAAGARRTRRCRPSNVYARSKVEVERLTDDARAAGHDDRDPALLQRLSATPSTTPTAWCRPSPAPRARRPAARCGWTARTAPSTSPMSTMWPTASCAWCSCCPPANAPCRRSTSSAAWQTSLGELAEPGGQARPRCDAGRSAGAQLRRASLRWRSAPRRGAARLARDDAAGNRLRAAGGGLSARDGGGQRRPRSRAGLRRTRAGLSASTPCSSGPG